MNLEQFVSALNTWGASRTPFFFLTDFELNQPLAFRLDEVDPNVLQYSINGFSNSPILTRPSGSVDLQLFPISFQEYETRFKRVQHHLGYGDSFLLNLTVKTPVGLNCSLQEIFNRAQARYKCWYQNEFIVFSPETFVQIRGNKIYAYPMKGTIDASVPYATDQILNDPKEKAEHVTIVDLIRNDLSQVATAVEVTRFRYVEEIKTNRARLLQVSSEITGRLPDDFHCQLGTLLVKLLPAGSVSGAPKLKTCSVIRAAEGCDRGFYSGVLGYFDGINLDSGVMIRFIEHQDGRYYYRSGGGITTQSEAAKEYQELLDKIYVPVN
ncbi:MAG: aminodeoxychorismate synthase component I [Flammeovirgaceae bacterium]|nr:MAG: aminodeoxychorismate synthase component I [Flammeovirgaceae bacterium]